MGILNPVCVATDGKYVYGLAYAPSYNDSSSFYNILIRSNEYPTPTINSWTLLSAVPREDYFYLWEENDGSRGYSCAVDSTGVFTALAQKSKSSKNAPADKLIRGLQYQPAGGGVWKNVHTSPNYVWSEMSIAHLVHVKDPVTATTSLIHVLLAKGSVQNSLAVASFDTNSLTMIQNPTLWDLDIEKHGLLLAVALMPNSTLFTYGRNTTTSYDTGVLTKINLSSGSTALPPASSLWTFRTFYWFSTCTSDFSFIMLTHKTNVYLLCKREKVGYSSTFFGVYDGGTGIRNEEVSGDLQNMRSLVPVNGAVFPYIFMHNATGVYGVMLDGTDPGQWQSSSTRISIPDSYGINTNPNGPSNSTSDSKGSGSSAGVIGGVCAAVVVVAAVALFMFYRRRKRPLQKNDSHVAPIGDTNTNASQAPANQQHQGRPAYLDGKFDVDAIPVEREMKLEATSQQPSEAAAPIYQDLYPTQQPQLYPSPSLASTTSQGVNGAYTSAAAQYSPSLHVHAPHVSPAFSNTSLDTFSTSQTGQAVPTFWEPRPFVPPARNANNANTSN
ncbi:MAG: hypothetical protein J3Q66DRAFT_355798 [Benniella sp.]|nr:MAG: hypothetical protein J3Q66DRAFT_355798 [Benniella sp.]